MVSTDGPTRVLPTSRRWSGLLDGADSYTRLVGTVDCPRVLVVMGPRVFRLRPAGTPHGMVRCNLTAGDGFSGRRVGRRRSEDRSGVGYIDEAR